MKSSCFSWPLRLRSTTCNSVLHMRSWAWQQLLKFIDQSPWQNHRPPN
jgi:hypothetical protein